MEDARLLDARRQTKTNRNSVSNVLRCPRNKGASLFTKHISN